MIDTDGAGEPFGYVSQAQFLAQGPSGRSLAHVESTVMQAGLIAQTFLTGLTIDVTVGARPVDIELAVSYLAVSAAATNANLLITDNAGAIKRAATFWGFGAGHSIAMLIRERLTIPGAYTRRAAVARNAGAGTVSHGLNSGLVVASLGAIER
jgi:hypothetical protein